MLREGGFSLVGASQARHIAAQDAAIVAGLLGRDLAGAR